MEPRNFSSPDATEKSREARLNKLRERRAKAVTSNNDTALRPINSESRSRIGRSPEPMRSPEPIVDNRFNNRSERNYEGRPESKVKPLPNRQGFVEARPELRPLENRTELRPRKKLMEATIGRSRSSHRSTLLGGKYYVLRSQELV